MSEIPTPTPKEIRFAKFEGVIRKIAQRFRVETFGHMNDTRTWAEFRVMSQGKIIFHTEFDLADDADFDEWTKQTERELKRRIAAKAVERPDELLR